MDHRSKYKTQNHKTLDGNTGENLNDLGYSNDFQIQKQRHNP